MSEWTKQNQHDSEIYTQGYNDGYDDCKIDMTKYKWHDLRKNPNDLPDDDRLVDCRTTDECPAYYGHYLRDAMDENLDRWIDTEGFTMQVVAWREVETFEEESK